MYSIAIIKSSINLYFKLKKDNIIGKKRIKYIEQPFNIHINILYKWINKYYNSETDSFNFSQYKTSFKYNNTKITNDIETFIINSIDANNNFNIKKIKKIFILNLILNYLKLQFIMFYINIILLIKN